MKQGRKWVIAAAVLAAVVCGAWLAFVALVPSDDDLAARASAELKDRLGVSVAVRGLHWRLLPVPAVVMEDAATEQPQPITVSKLTAYPNLGALLARRLQFDRIELQGAVVPQLSLRALDARPSNALADVGALPLERFVFRNLTWVSRHGVAVVYDGEIDFDPNWRPRKLHVRRPGFQPATDLTLTRQGQEDRWAARINVGGGTANGELELQARASGRMQLEGRLQPVDVEVASAVEAFNRKPVIGGRASGQTQLSASGASVGELARSLRTQTAFTMGRSTLLRFDLDKAIRSLGQEHVGETRLDSVTGQLETQNTPQGMVATYTNVKASSGALSASGKARLANRQIEAEFAVDLVDGLVGVPLILSGPVNKVAVSVPKGAVAGAVLGTAVLPGIGTAIGARLGATLGNIFSPDPSPKPAAKP